MARVLEEIFSLRTKGNGYIEQEWDDVLLKRDIARLMADGRVREVPCSPSKSAKYSPQGETRCFRDLETGDTYEYVGPWERGGPRFYKLSSD
jgi:hypothetical protein